MNDLPRNYTHTNNTLHFRDTDLLQLAKRYKTPLRVSFPDVLTENFAFLKKTVESVLEKHGVAKEKFLCGYAIKANQHYDLVARAAKHTDFLEVSSRNDLDLIESIENELGSKMIICHGFKTANTPYFEKILELHRKGFNTIPIIDSVTELYDFGNLDYPMDVGLRVNANISFGGALIPDRFGLTPDEVAEHSEYLVQHKKLSLRILHTHVANTISDINQRLIDLDVLISLYRKFHDAGKTIPYLCAGGGLPDRLNTPEHFYVEFYERLIQKIKGGTSDIPFPTLLNESGRYLAAETQLTILKVILEKENNAEFSWYVLDGSAINLIPETTLDPDKHFQILAINLLDAPTKNVVCAGATCDQADFFHTRKLRLPTFTENEPLFIAVPGTGAYQESLLGASRNMPGHCLIDGAETITIIGSNTTTQEMKKDFLTSLGYEKKGGFFQKFFFRS